MWNRKAHNPLYIFGLFSKKYLSYKKKIQKYDCNIYDLTCNPFTTFATNFHLRCHIVISFATSYSIFVNFQKMIYFYKYSHLLILNCN